MEKVAEYPVFVYGTLKKGKSAHKFLKGAEYFGEYGVRGSLYGHGDVAYPMMKITASGLVFGELYGVTENMLASMDRYEGHPHHYKRTLTSLWKTNGIQLDDDAWVYEYQGSVEGLDVISEGVF